MEVTPLTRRLAVAVLALPLLLAPPAAPAAAQDAAPSPTVVVVRVDDLITAGMAEFIVEELERAQDLGVPAVVIQLNTPGGLVDATLKILQAISQAEVPVITWVGPPGAIAASAGSFILVAGHVAAMAPGTTTGAAMPVTLDPAGGEPQPAEEKTINFLAGHLRSLARARGRPADVVEEFVTENRTLEADEALELGVVDLVAEDVDALLKAVDGRTVRLPGEREATLHTADAPVEEARMTLQRRFQHLVSNPELAFLLLVGGAYGLYLGLVSPGTLVPETLGAILVLLGIYGLGLFETSLTGILLVLLGLAFLIAEAFVTTHGILAVAGAISLALGALLLPREPLLPGPWLIAFRNTAVGVALAFAALSGLVLTAVVRTRRQRAREGTGAEFPRRGRTTTPLSPEGWVRLGGELWRARSEGQAVPAGVEVEVVAREGLTVVVRPVGPAQPAGETRETGGNA